MSKKKADGAKPVQPQSSSGRKSYYSTQKGRTDDNKRLRLAKRLRHFPNDAQAADAYRARFGASATVPTPNKSGHKVLRMAVIKAKKHKVRLEARKAIRAAAKKKQEAA